MCRILKNLSLLLLAGSLSLAVSGCKSSSTTVKAPLAPGAYNSTDQVLYQSLMAAQASLNSLKGSVDSVPLLKPVLNQAILDYNAAESAWQVYHVALLTNPSAPAAPVQDALTRVNSDLTNLSSQLPSLPK